MSFSTNIVWTVILVFHFWLTVINSMESKRDERHKANAKRCYDSMESYFGKDPDALRCVKEMILRWHEDDKYIDFVTDYYLSFRDKLIANSIMDTTTFCNGKVTNCKLYLLRFKEDPLDAAKYALYKKRLSNPDNIVLDFNTPEHFNRLGSGRLCMAVPSIKCKKGLCPKPKSTTATNKNQEAEDICDDYLQHIQENIQLKENQVSPRDHCENITINPSFNPDDKETQTDSDDLFELSGIP